LEEKWFPSLFSGQSSHVFYSRFWRVGPDPWTAACMFFLSFPRRPAVPRTFFFLGLSTQQNPIFTCLPGTFFHGSAFDFWYIELSSGSITSPVPTSSLGCDESVFPPYPVSFISKQQVRNSFFSLGFLCPQTVLGRSSLLFFCWCPAPWDFPFLIHDRHKRCSLAPLWTN